MGTAKKMWRLLTIVLVLGLGAGCKLSAPPEANNTGVYSYKVDEIAAGLFGAKSPTMTMNEWYMTTRPPWETPETYDSWSQREKNYLYQDEAFKIPFAGSDILDEDTVIHCDFSFNGQGKKIGEITGTITLTDIPYPAATKVYMSTSSYSGYPSNWWSLYRKINTSGVTGTPAQLSWSLPVYESLKSNSQATFSLIVLPGDSLNTYTVAVPTGQTISNANANVGDLGTVSVKGVTLSGTITITYKGQPVPYVEIYANYDVQGTLGITCLSSPGPNTPWAVTFGIDKNLNKEMTFQVFVYSEKNGNLQFDRYVSLNSPVYVVDNQGVSGIVLDVIE
jgi:hypothetical protein